MHTFYSFFGINTDVLLHATSIFLTTIRMSMRPVFLPPSLPLAFFYLLLMPLL